MKNFLSAINCKQQIPDGSSPRVDLLCWDTENNPEWGALHALGIFPSICFRDRICTGQRGARFWDHTWINCTQPASNTTNEMRTGQKCLGLSSRQADAERQCWEDRSNHCLSSELGGTLKSRVAMTPADNTLVPVWTKCTIVGVTPHTPKQLPQKVCVSHVHVSGEAELHA